MSRRDIPQFADDDTINETVHTLTFGPELPTTFVNTLRGLMEKSRPLYVQVWLDEVGSGREEDLVGPLSFSAQRVIGHYDLTALSEAGDGDDKYEEHYLVVFPCDEDGERVEHSAPRFIPAWHIVRLHVV